MVLPPSFQTDTKVDVAAGIRPGTLVPGQRVEFAVHRAGAEANGQIIRRGFEIGQVIRVSAKSVKLFVPLDGDFENGAKKYRLETIPTAQVTLLDDTKHEPMRKRYVDISHKVELQRLRRLRGFAHDFAWR